jgi:hypothetical protein
MRVGFKSPTGTYITIKIREGLKRSGRNVDGYRDVLDSVAEHLALPWESSYFEDAERRRIIGGIGRYGWFGQVFASGGFAHLISEEEQATARNHRHRNHEYRQNGFSCRLEQP